MRECWIKAQFLQKWLITVLFKIVREQTGGQRLIYNREKTEGSDFKCHFEKLGGRPQEDKCMCDTISSRFFRGTGGKV